MRILIVEDEARLADSIARGLREEGFVVEVSHDGEDALHRLRSEPFDLAVLDVMLPKRDGFDVCRTLRQRGVITPILMLTARGQVVDRVVGLKLGADDYLIKPFEALELLARVEALLRRAGQSAAAAAPARSAGSAKYTFDDVVVDVRKAEVTRDGAPVELSAKEFQLLRYFLEHRGATLSRDELLQEVWGYEHTPSTRTVDVHVAWLRQKLEVNPKVPQAIVTVHGLGYKFAG